MTHSAKRKNTLRVLAAMFPLLAILMPCPANGQGQPYAVWEHPATSDYWFVRLDAATGQKTDIAVIPGMTAFVSGNNTAFDTDLNRYHVMGLSGATQRFYTIEASSGVVVHNVTVPDVLYGITYHCTDSMLYAVRVSGNNYDLVTLDAASAVISPIAALPGITAVVSESFVIDRLSGWYCLVVQSGPSRFLKAYDLASGLQVSSQPFPDNLTGIRYSCADSALFGLWENGSSYQLERIIIPSGGHFTTGVLAGVTPGFVAESASVSNGGNYTYRGFDAGNNFALISIDLSTAGVLASQVTMDNAKGFEEGICCQDTMTTGIAPAGPLMISCYPQPARDLLFLEFDLPVHLVEISTATGHRVLQQHAPASRSWELGVAYLPAGTYVLSAYMTHGRSGRRVILLR